LPDARPHYCLVAIMKALFLHAMSACFLRVALVLCCCFCLLEATADSHRPPVESADERASLKESWKKLSREEREELRHQMRTAWQLLSQEEHERLREECRKKGNRKKEDKRDGNWSGKPQSGKSGDRKDREEHCLRKGYKERWHSLSPEEQEAFKSKLREVLVQKEKQAGEGRASESVPLNQQTQQTQQTNRATE